MVLSPGCYNRKNGPKAIFFASTYQPFARPPRYVGGGRMSLAGAISFDASGPRACRLQIAQHRPEPETAPLTEAEPRELEQPATMCPALMHAVRRSGWKPNLREEQSSS